MPALARMRESPRQTSMFWRSKAGWGGKQGDQQDRRVNLRPHHAENQKPKGQREGTNVVVVVR